MFNYQRVSFLGLSGVMLLRAWSGASLNTYRWFILRLCPSGWCCQNTYIQTLPSDKLAKVWNISILNRIFTIDCHFQKVLPEGVLMNSNDLKDHWEEHGNWLDWGDSFPMAGGTVQLLLQDGAPQ